MKKEYDTLDLNIAGWLLSLFGWLAHGQQWWTVSLAFLIVAAVMFVWSLVLAVKRVRELW